MDSKEQTPISRDLVDLEMSKLNMRLAPGSQHPADQMKRIVDMVCEDMDEARVTAVHFLNAVREWRRRSRFLPTSSDLLTVHRELVSKSPKSTTRALPPGDSFRAFGPVLARANELMAGGAEPKAAYALAMRETGRSPQNQHGIR